METHSNPSYSSPPLVEVAMSIQFAPPDGLSLAHLGVYWSSVRDVFPSVRTTQPIGTRNEVFGKQGPWLPPSLRLALTNEPECRLQMTSFDEQWMCQLQQNRVVINWRKRSDAYPRYSATRERILETWNSWLAFLTHMDLPIPVPQIWEITYVNRIPQGGLWTTPSDWPKVFPGILGGPIANVDGVVFGGIQGQFVWESSEPPARLFVEPKPGPDNVLLLTLTARGPVAATANESGSASRFLAGFDCGHELIVRTFQAISSQFAKDFWNDTIV